MKSHISATIDRELLERIDRYRKAVRRSRSQVIEIAVERLLREEAGEGGDLIVSEGQFEGTFNRRETYER
jgi:metal-responsive CopG/Arc/MetJ family transcriptional regulator